MSLTHTSVEHVFLPLSVNRALSIRLFLDTSLIVRSLPFDLGTNFGVNALSSILLFVHDNDMLCTSCSDLRLLCSYYIMMTITRFFHQGD